MKKILFQIGFWVAFFTYNVVDDLLFRYELTDSLINSVHITLPIAILVYLNALWLFPKFFYKKKYLKYTVIFILASITLIFVFLFDFFHGDFYDYILHDFIFDFVQTLLVVGGISSIGLMTEQIRTKEKLAIIQKDQIATKLKFLKAQTNPHFLFNTLNNIYFLIKKDTIKASEVLITLSDLLRYQLYETDTETIEVEKEIEQLQNYIELEKIRLGDRLTLESNINYETHGLKIPPLLLLPLFENAFKHGIGSDFGYISFELKVSNNQLDLIIENSLADQSKKPEQTKEDEQIKKSGLGIPNLKKRLELLYKDNYSFTYGINGEKYKTQLIIKL